MKPGICQPGNCFGAIILIAPVPTHHGPVWEEGRVWWLVREFGLASLGGILAERVLFFFGYAALSVRLDWGLAIGTSSMISVLQNLQDLN